MSDTSPELDPVSEPDPVPEPDPTPEVGSFSELGRGAELVPLPAFGPWPGSATVAAEVDPTPESRAVPGGKLGVQHGVHARVGDRSELGLSAEFNERVYVLVQSTFRIDPVTLNGAPIIIIVLRLLVLLLAYRPS